MNPDDFARFTGKVSAQSGGCWQWTAGRTGSGYGAFWMQGAQALAHRASYEHHVGPVPVDKQLDHLCRNRACVNPAHLEPVSCQVNLLRGDSLAAANAVKTHCPKNHEYTPANTKLQDNRRYCRTCVNAARRLRYARTAAA